MLPETHQVRLANRVSLSPRVSLVSVEFQSQIDFVPGQWMSVVFPLLGPDSKPLRRSYSIASQRSSRVLEFAVTQVDGGLGSTFLHQAPVGTPLEAKGPQGRFEHHRQTPSLWVATGTGAAPFRPMLQAALQARDTSPVHLLFGARSERDELFADEWRAVEKTHPWFQLTTSLSQPSGEWRGKTGYVQHHVRQHFEALQVKAPAPVQVWICGVRKMLDEVRNVLKSELQLERQRIHAERYD
jgi:anthranilate 1,2-dioxygenase reductase component